MNWKYFKLQEFTQSQIAQKLKISNNPSQESIQNLDLLVSNILDPLRESWGSPIKITSGYRSPKLNKVVGGVNKSHHIYGKAADIFPINNKFNDFIDFIKNFLKDKEFSQCIIEKKGNSKWIHISYDKNNNKKEFKTINK